MSFFEKIHSSRADVKLRKISGEDSFRCIVSACTGYIVGKDESAEVCIVSKNNEYESIGRFWKGDYKISMQENISGKKSETNNDISDNDIYMEEIFKMLGIP